MATLKSIKNSYNQNLVDTNIKNISLLSFKLATADSLSKFNLVDGFVDDYQDATGVDAGGSTGETRTGDNYYTGVVAGNYYGDSSLGACTFGASGITQTGDTTAIDTVLSTGSEAGGPGSSSYGYGVPNSSACYELTVPNTSGAYDGDMVVANFTSLTIDASVTLTTKQPNRGMLIYVKGNCTINGSLSMSARGGFSDPTSSGGSDSAVVNANGLQLGLMTSGGSQTLAAATFAGAGTGAVTAVGNQDAISGNGSIFTILKTGGAGATGHSHAQSGYGQRGPTGTAGATGANTISTGGGGSGGAWGESGTANTGTGGAGGAFSGGAGSGGSASQGSSCNTGNAGNYGGAGTNGCGNWGGAKGSGNWASGNKGVGGIIWLLVDGVLTIGSGATIEAKGADGQGAQSTPGVGAGGAGAGAIFALYSGSLANSGSITAPQTTGGGSTASISSGGYGAAGGVQTAQIAIAASSEDMTLVSNAKTAQANPTTIRVMMDEYTSVGSSTLDTDIKAYASRDNGTTWTQTALTSQGTIETNHRYLSGSADVSGQPAGANVKYKIETLNQSDTKETRVYGTSVAWA